MTHAYNCSIVIDVVVEEQLHELDDELLEEELLELSEVTSIDALKSIDSVSFAKSGLCICNCASHFFESLGLLLELFSHTIGKLIVLTKFCVIATVSVIFKTTCHQPDGTKTVSPGL